MKRIFIETKGFTSAVYDFMSELDLVRFQQALMINPQSGTVIPGCGGLRKIRIPDPRRHKGKRGGARIIYLDIPEANWIVLLDIYGKDEKESLDSKTRQRLYQIAQEIKRACKRH